MPDVVIIGAGPNGLIAAAYLARAGLAPLVLERRPVVGGRLVTEEIHPGFRCPTVLHTAGPLHPDVVSDLKLEAHGFRAIEPEVRLLTLLATGQALKLYGSATRSAVELQRFSPHDAGRFSAFSAAIARVSGIFRSLLRDTPPSLDDPAGQDLALALRAAGRYIALGRRDRVRLLQWLTLPVADLVTDWFDHEGLRATIAARALFGTFLGPRSAGTTLTLLLQAASAGHPLGSATFCRGGPGALTTALAAAATSAGAEIRTGQRVAAILVRHDAVAGVVLENGDEISARLVVSAVDPKQTFLEMVAPQAVDPVLRSAVRQYRARGAVAKVNLALSALPRFGALEAGEDGAAALAGRIHIGSDVDQLEHAFDAAKYGGFSEQPFLEVTLPSLADPSLAPAGAHVMSIYAQFAPHALRGSTWDAQRDRLGDIVIRTLSEHAPGIEDLVVARQVLTPADLESTHGLTDGHLFHGEPALDQLFALRPLAALSRYRSPIRGLYLCGEGTHPGFGVTGCSGANASREILKDRVGTPWRER